MRETDSTSGTMLERLETARLAVDAENYEEGWKIANACLAENFDDPTALYLLAFIALKHDQLGLAYNLFRLVTALVPDKAEPWNNMGMCFQERWANQADLDEAERCFRKAYELDPDDKHAMNNIGLVNIHKYKPEATIQWCNKALAKDPDMIQAIDNRSLAHLMLGQWTEGWRDYERALGHIEERKERIYGDEARWDGSKGKHLVLYGTQGIGDEISFASIVPDAIRDSASVVLECDRRLEGLFKRSFPEAEVFGTRFKNKLPHWLKGNRQIDARCSTDMLGKFYRNADSDFPGCGFLVPDPERRIQWRALFEELGDRPKIGIAWTGGLPRTGAQKRSLHLEDFLPILTSINATWVSLQYKDPSAEIEQLQETHGITVHHWPRVGEAYDIDELAAAISELDLVITVTTATVHLTGALGKEAWVLAPRKSRWFYGHKGSSIPWYKSIEMFRQKGGEWPIHDIVKRLQLRYGHDHKSYRRDHAHTGRAAESVTAGA